MLISQFEALVYQGSYEKLYGPFLATLQLYFQGDIGRAVCVVFFSVSVGECLVQIENQKLFDSRLFKG